MKMRWMRVIRMRVMMKKKMIMMGRKVDESDKDESDDEVDDGEGWG